MLSADETEDNKAKIGITPPHSPASLSSFNGKPQNGFFNSSTAYSPKKRSVSETSDGGIDGHFKFLEGYSTYPEVFTISSTTTSPTTDSLSRKSEKSHGQTTGSLGTSSLPEDKYKWTETTSADETKHRKTKSRKLCVILLVTTLVIGLLAGVAVILALKVFGVGEPSEDKMVTTIRPDILLLDGSLDLMETWQPELDDPTSSLYIETANNFTSEMDILMQNSVYNDSYIDTVVTNFSPGSVKARFNMRFRESYKLRSDNKTTFAQLIQKNVRTNSDKTSLRINKGTVYIEAIEKLATTTSRSSSASTDSTTSSTVSTTISSTIASTTSSTMTSPLSPTMNSTSSPTLYTITEIFTTNAPSQSTSTSTTLSSTTSRTPRTTISTTTSQSSTSSNTASTLSSTSTLSSMSATSVASTTSTPKSTTDKTPSSTSTSQPRSTPNMTTRSTVSSTTISATLSSSSSIMSTSNTTLSSMVSLSTSNMTNNVTRESSTISSISSAITTVSSPTSTTLSTQSSTSSSTPSKTTSSTPSTTISSPSNTTTIRTSLSSTKSSTPSTTTSVTSSSLTTSSMPSKTASSTSSSTTSSMPSSNTSSMPSTTTSSTPRTTTSSMPSTTTSIKSPSSTLLSTASTTTIVIPPSLITSSMPSTSTSVTSPSSTASSTLSTTVFVTSPSSTTSSTTSTTPSVGTSSSTTSSTSSSTSHTTTTKEQMSSSTSSTSTSSTLSTTTTAKPDSPPTANAGPDKTITLPVNSVYLYGNTSSDDRQITQFLWQKVTNLPADMSGTRSSILYVTNLMEGAYMFKLTVRDRRGQSDRDTVVISVKPAARDSPPTANAGPDKKITLPVNSVYLYGNTSSDDQQITQYLWQRVTNLQADMSGTRSSILYVTNLVEGTYLFKLTVRDGRGQSDHDSVEVTVNPAPTTTTTTTTIQPDLCVEVTLETCIHRGFTHTLMPNLMGHDTVEEAGAAFDIDASGVMNQLCQEVALTYLCSLYFPKCDVITGDLFFPCASLCQEATNLCGAFFTNPYECEVFQVDMPTCIQQVTTTEAPTTTQAPFECEPTVLNDCKALGFTETIYPNFFHEPNQTVALESFDLIFKAAVSGSNVCSDKLLFFICSIQFPKCTAGVRKAPCQRTCHEIVQNCPDYEYYFNCDFFPELGCVAPPEQPAVLRKGDIYCRSDEYSCGEVHKCVARNKVCDGVNDCGDYTDEMECTCESHQYKCAMGMCIKLFQRCDGIFQCPDKSDEDNCKCKNGQIACPDGTCIMSEWRCDDFADCSDSWDEMDCAGNCTSSQFRCKDHSCLDMKKVCNLENDCADGDDEWDCIRQDAFLRLRYKKFFLPLCANTWREEYGDYTCDLLGMGSYIGYSEKYTNGYTFYQLPENSNGTEPSVLGQLDKTRCPGKRAVVVNCQPRGCGKKLAPGIVNFIVNGETAAKGAWPWQAGLYYGGQYFCGGTLINRNFVLTAAHCVEVYKSDFRLMTVKLGAHNRKEEEVTQHVVAVEAIKSHRQHVYFEKNDIALLQLANPVNYTTYIQPVCLPEEGETLPLYSLCYTIGWGKTKWDGEYAEVLQQLKMTLWDTQKCNSSVAWNGEVYDTFLCAGYVSGVRSICKGDSGGPLLCLDKTHTWKVIGVSSYVANYCNMTDRPNIFTDVRHFIQWIEEHVECRFRCTNGKCLYNLDQVCDREDNCGDNSDEDRECNKTVQCDFEDKYLCGYTFSGWKVGYDNKLALRTIIDGQVHTQSYAPQFDHTVGRYPGHFLYGKEKNFLSAELESPPFTTTEQTCIRFFYYLRGEISIGFTAKLIEYYKTGKNTSTVKVRSGKIQNAKDEWKMAYFDVTPGKFRVQFLAGDLFKTAIDDIQTIPGMCQDVLCDKSTEFWCMSAYGDKCISKVSRCDLAVECDFAFDERGCPSPTNSYLCTFDNGNLCSLRQDVDDASDWWFMNASMVQKEIRDSRFLDYSTGLDTGYVLYLNTYILQADTNVYMRQTFKLDYYQYCLSFHYQMRTDATFEIHLECNGCKSTTHTVMETFVGWTLYQMDLPLVDTLKVTYDAHASSEIDSFYFSFIAIDDLTVTPGLCPSYVCPGNLAKCRTLNRCVPQSVICDREVNCLDESDEENCVCNSNEFQCTSGRCIDLEKKCNKVTDCLDGSDEGNTCVALNDVSCDFEHPYMCGYEFVTSTEYTWLRHKGGTATPITGPHADHTLGTQFGYYVYTEANQGSQGDKASLVSPEFYSGFGKSLDVYYHMFSTAVKHVRLGSLVVSLEDSDTKEQLVLWKSEMNLIDSWQDLCLDLPLGITGRIVFTATRCNETIYGVDKAIDDIALQNHLCSEIPESTTTATPITTTTTKVTTSGSGCPSGQWLCGNTVTCIQASYQCDGMSDCPDGSDELDCL